jgi:hypothetical protein
MKVTLNLVLLLPALIGALPELPFQRDVEGRSVSGFSNEERDAIAGVWGLKKEKRDAGLEDRAPIAGVWGLRKEKRDAELEDRAPIAGVWGLKKVKRDEDSFE